MTPTNPHPIAERLREVADRLEMAANNTLKSADWFWGWRKRDRKISIAFGTLSRDLREVAAALRAQATDTPNNGGSDG